MTPFYRGERLINSGETVNIGDRLPPTRVVVSDENIALVVPSEGSGIYVGQAMLVRNGSARYSTWQGEPRFVLKNEIVLQKESASTSKTHPQVVWRKR